MEQKDAAALGTGIKKPVRIVFDFTAKASVNHFSMWFRQYKTPDLFRKLIDFHIFILLMVLNG